jgi:hypothetical protein
VTAARAASARAAAGDRAGDKGAARDTGARDTGADRPAAGGPAATYRARQMLARAHWAAGAFAGYDRASVLRIAEAVATTAHSQARRYAEWAVSETGFGVAAHKVRKNEACSLGVFEHYRHEDLVSPRVDADAKIVSHPGRPGSSSRSPPRPTRSAACSSRSSSRC